MRSPFTLHDSSLCNNVSNYNLSTVSSYFSMNNINTTFYSFDSNNSLDILKGNSSSPIAAIGLSNNANIFNTNIYKSNAIALAGSYLSESSSLTNINTSFSKCNSDSSINSCNSLFNIPITDNSTSTLGISNNRISSGIL